jgi:hypothetical protein
MVPTMIIVNNGPSLQGKGCGTQDKIDLNLDGTKKISGSKGFCG